MEWQQGAPPARPESTADWISATVRSAANPGATPEGEDPRSVSVSNVHFAATQDELKAFFTAAGEVTEVHNEPGIKVITFASAEAANWAVATLDQAEFYGMTIKVAKPNRSTGLSWLSHNRPQGVYDSGFASGGQYGGPPRGYGAPPQHHALQHAPPYALQPPPPPYALQPHAPPFPLQPRALTHMPPPPHKQGATRTLRDATANDIDAARAAYEAATSPAPPPQHYGAPPAQHHSAPPPPQTYAPAPPADTPLAIRLRHAAAQWDVTRAERQLPARARDRSPSPASPDIGTRPKRRHIVAAPEAESTPEPPAPVEDVPPPAGKVVAAPIKFSLGGAFDKNDGAAFSNDGSFLKAVKQKLTVAPVEEAAAPPPARPLGIETPAEDDDDDDCYEVSLGMRPGAAAAADDDSGDDEGYTVRLGMEASTAVPPVWATSARALLEASRERKLGDLRAALTTHGFICGPPVVGSGYFLIEAPKTYPCVMDVIGREYPNSKSSGPNCSFRIRSQKQLVKYLEGALERGAGVRLESAWDWAAHTDSLSRSRSQSPPPRSAEAAADASPPRTPPPKRARTEPATIYAWCEARGWAADSTRYRDIIMCCDDLDALAIFWDHPERAEVLEDWPTLARSRLKRGIKGLRAARAQ